MTIEKVWIVTNARAITAAMYMKKGEQVNNRCNVNSKIQVTVVYAQILSKKAHFKVLLAHTLIHPYRLTLVTTPRFF